MLGLMVLSFLECRACLALRSDRLDRSDRSDRLECLQVRSDRLGRWGLTSSVRLARWGRLGHLDHLECLQVHSLHSARWARWGLTSLVRWGRLILACLDCLAVLEDLKGQRDHGDLDIDRHRIRSFDSNSWWRFFRRGVFISTFQVLRSDHISIALTMTCAMDPSLDCASTLMSSPPPGAAVNTVGGKGCGGGAKPATFVLLITITAPGTGTLFCRTLNVRVWFGRVKARTSLTAKRLNVVGAGSG